ncbi:MAG: polymer-forming cytoskeletal protein [Romboutsia timonensis]
MESLKPIEQYTPTEWHNYIPPSIDQNKLNHLEENMQLNRDTINAIIERLGIKTEGGSSKDDDIYSNPIYTTLIAHKNELERLEKDKLDLSKYNSQLGDFTKLQGGSTLVEAINNRLRRDIDDSADHTYTFKKLILRNGTSEGLNVTGSATISRNLTVAGINSSALIKSTAGMETTTLKATDAVTFTKTLGVTGKITGNGGLDISNGANVTGTLTVDNLIVKGSINCTGNATFSSNVGAKTITTSSTITADDAIRTRKAFHSTDEYIEFHWNSSPLHKLYVHGGGQGLDSGDAFIQTVS